MKQAVTISVFLMLLPALSFIGFAGTVKTNEPQNTIKFTENKNQWDKKVFFRAQLDGGVMFLEKNCFTYNFYDKESLRETHGGGGTTSASTISASIRQHAFRMTFLNAASGAAI